jgi:hypothetical protein
MRLSLSLGLLWLVACKPGSGDSESSVGNSDPENPGDNIAGDFDLQENPDCEQVHDQESGESYDLAGATSYFVGNFAIDGDAVSGFEAWVLFANDTWSAGEGYDCQFLWAAEGTKIEPQCLSCAYSLEMHMTMDMVGSNCVAGLKNDTASDAAEFDVTYDVVVEDGKSTFYFENGNVLGNGDATDSGVTYVSDPACKWF